MNTGINWERFWKDKHGKVVLWQSPNVLLVAWFIFTLLSKIMLGDKLQTLAGVMAFGVIFTWGWLEATTGVNYFRRLLGIIVMVASVYSKIK